MISDYNSKVSNQYEFTVKRISHLQNILSSVEQRTVNSFITQVRHSVCTYHEHRQTAAKNKKIKVHEKFFIKLNDRAHQLARFTLELSLLVNEAPAELVDEAKKADQEIDKIHGHLVNLCLTIDKLSQQKSNFYHDAKMTVEDIYKAYCRIFNTTPTDRSYGDDEEIPKSTAVEDLLVPVVEILILKDRQRCHKLIESVRKRIKP